jgi:hypothetical protein
LKATTVEMQAEEFGVGRSHLGCGQPVAAVLPIDDGRRIPGNSRAPAQSTLSRVPRDLVPAIGPWADIDYFSLVTGLDFHSRE